MANSVTRRDRPAPVARRFSEWDPFERMRELMQWEPFQDLPRRWFGEEALSGFAPRFDVREEKGGLLIKADLPGLGESEVEVSVTNGCLSISGKREDEKVEDSGSYYCRERSHGAFSRTFTLPDNVDVDQIQASMRDGVLEVRVPMSAELQPKKIPVRPHDGGSAASGGDAESRTPAGESL